MYKIAIFCLDCSHAVGNQKVPCLFLCFQKEDDFKLFIVYSSDQGKGLLACFSDQELSFLDKTAIEKEIKKMPVNNFGNQLGILDGTSAKTVACLMFSHPIITSKETKVEEGRVFWEKLN